MGSGGSAAKYRENGQYPALVAGTRVLPVTAAVRGGDRRSYRRSDALHRRPNDAAQYSMASTDGTASTAEGPPSSASRPPSSASRAATPISFASGGSKNSRTCASCATADVEATVPMALFGSPPLPPGSPPRPLVRKPWASSNICSGLVSDLPPLRPPSSHFVVRPQAVPPEKYVKSSPIARMAADYWKYEDQSRTQYPESSSQ